MGRRFLGAVGVVIALMLMATGCPGGGSSTEAGESLVRGFFAGAKNEGELATILGGSATRSDSAMRWLRGGTP